MSHTPGPWTTSRGTFGWFVHPIADDMQLEKVAQDISTEEDARLIAAAPDLLEAARDLIEEYDQAAEVGGIDGKSLYRHLIEVRRAIAKAEGQDREVV